MQDSVAESVVTLSHSPEDSGFLFCWTTNISVCVSFHGNQLVTQLFSQEINLQNVTMLDFFVS